MDFDPPSAPPRRPRPPLGPEGLDALRFRAKGQIRSRMRALRSAVPAKARAERSQAIVARVSALPEVLAARAVALFWPMDDRGEVDLRALDAELRARSVAIYYPFMDGPAEGETGFRRLESESALIRSAAGFLEPPASSPRASSGDLDVVVVPALAVSEDGHRLGYGAGFYDRTVPAFRPPARSVVVAFDFQLLAELPTTAHDVPNDVVVTDSRVIVPGA